MARFFLILLFGQAFILANGQSNLPATYLFDEPPTAIFAQTIYNDTIVCVGTVLKEGDTIHFQQGAFIAFIDSCGSLIHYRKYFDPQGRDIFLNLSNKIIRTKDGGFCFLGSLGLQNLLIKTDSKGDSVFIREYPLPPEFVYASFQSVHEINNALYVVGYGGTSVPIEDDLFMCKFDQHGNQIAYWRFQSPENCEYFQDATVKGSNIVVSVAQTNACVSGIFKSKTRIFEVDTSSNVIWDWVDTVSNLKRGGGLGLKSTLDGGWIYSGAYNDTFIGAWQYDRLFVTKIDSNRNLEWTHIIGYKNIDSYNSFRDIAIDSDGNFIVAGQYLTGNPDFPDPNPATAAIVTKISPSGGILWTNIVKAFENEPDNGMLMFTNNVNLLSSGNIIIGGYLYRILPLDLQNEGWLAKLSPSGKVLDDSGSMCGFVSLQHLKTEIVNDIRSYPNPAGETLKIKANGDLPAGSVWRFFDTFGRILYMGEIDDKTKELEVNISVFLPGMYFWEMRTKDERLLRSGKVVKQ